MGLKIFDQYTYLHFASGIIADFFNISILTWFVIHSLFEIIENNSHLSAEEIAGLVNLSTIGVRYHLNNLKIKKRIKRKGHGKGGSWEILK